MRPIADETARLRAAGLCLSVMSSLLLLYGPYHRAYSEANVPSATDHAVFGSMQFGPLADDPANVVTVPVVLGFLAVRFLSTVTVIPAVLAVVGAGVVWTGRGRSLTPARAAAAIPLALAPIVVLVHLEPVGAGACDTGLCTDPLRPAWTRPDGVLEIAEAMFREGAVAFGGAGILFVGGVATAREGSSRWVPAFVCYVVGWAIAILLADPGLVFSLVFWVGVSGLLGYPLWKLGQRVAAPPDEGTVSERDPAADADAAVG